MFNLMYNIKPTFYFCPGFFFKEKLVHENHEICTTWKKVLFHSTT